MNIKYQDIKEACLKCRKCHDAGLCFTDSFPLFMKKAPVNTDLLFVFEAPNFNDTFDQKKGHLTFGPDTDDTGNFFWDLFSHELQMDPEQHLFVTNCVLCLPSLSLDGKHPVLKMQMRNCSMWLKALIDTFQPKVVCTIGVKALVATSIISNHPWRQMSEVYYSPQRWRSWYGRILYPLYHTSRLARNGENGRSEKQQRSDWCNLRQFILSQGIIVNNP